MLSRARLEMPSRGPIARANAPPMADAQSIGNNPNAPKHSAAPQPSSRWVKLTGCLTRRALGSNSVGDTLTRLAALGTLSRTAGDRA
jgi:hypothetical protein